MCAGIIKHENIIKGKAAGVGTAMIVGSTTGRDGAGGASLVSVELGEAKTNSSGRDPFMKPYRGMSGTFTKQVGHGHSGFKCCRPYIFFL